jgi:hypothetical protein
MDFWEVGFQTKYMVNKSPWPWALLEPSLGLALPNVGPYSAKAHSQGFTMLKDIVENFVV